MMQKESVVYSAGSHFTLLSLSHANQSSAVIIDDGRAIFSLAQAALKNGKKALSVENWLMLMESFHQDGMMKTLIISF